ncbi:hypothetical protein LJK87_22895 [Paenibacillus sp. P25]|nr:hypothetical protein LJK87_22895 [Paenibacillus sp. P25]
MSKYLTRILVYSFLIGPVPIICLGLITAYFSWNDNEAKAAAMRAEILRQNQRRVEQMMRTLELSIAQFAASSPVKKALFEEVKPDDFVTIQELWMSLYNLQTFVDVQKSFLIHMDHGWVIESGRVVKFSSLEQFGQKERFRQFAQGKESMKWISWNENAPEPVIQLVAKFADDGSGQSGQSDGCRADRTKPVQSPDDAERLGPELYSGRRWRRHLVRFCRERALCRLQCRLVRQNSVDAREDGAFHSRCSNRTSQRFLHRIAPIRLDVCIRYAGRGDIRTAWPYLVRDPCRLRAEFYRRGAAGLLRRLANVCAGPQFVQQGKRTHRA